MGCKPVTLVVVKLKFFSFFSFIVLNCFNHLILFYFFMQENHEDELNFKENHWRFEDRSILMKHSCGRNESFPNQVLFALRMRRGADATLTNLFNPTSGRDASHLCLISTWPKEGCTIVCVIFPKRTILDWGKIRSASVYDLESVFECIE